MPIAKNFDTTTDKEKPFWKSEQQTTKTKKNKDSRLLCKWHRMFRPTIVLKKKKKKTIVLTFLKLLSFFFRRGVIKGAEQKLDIRFIRRS